MNHVKSTDICLGVLDNAERRQLRLKVTRDYESRGYNVLGVEVDSNGTATPILGPRVITTGATVMKFFACNLPGSVIGWSEWPKEMPEASTEIYELHEPFIDAGCSHVDEPEDDR